MQDKHRLFLIPGPAFLWSAMLIAMLVGLEVYAGPAEGRLGLALHNSAHGPFFFILALVLERLLNTSRRFCALSPMRQSWTLMVALLFLAVATEAVQLWTPRDASWGDVATNLLGGTAAAVWIMAARPESYTKSRLQQCALRTLSILLILWSTTPALTAVTAYTLRINREPVIFSADHVLPRYFLTAMGTQIDVNIPEYVKQFSGHAARVEFLDRNWPGVSIYPFPDWRQYRQLKLAISLIGDDPMDLHLRVNDFNHNQEYSDRYNTTFSLQPGENILAIELQEIERGPAGRLLDLRNIERLVVFTTRRWHGRVIYLHKIWLE